MFPENLPTCMKKRENHKFRRILSSPYPSTGKRNINPAKFLFYFYLSDCSAGAEEGLARSMRAGGGNETGGGGVTPPPASESPTSYKFPVGQFLKP
jgi:hypothetical protein